MPSSPSIGIPMAPRIGVFQAFLLILEADEKQPFSQAFLRERGVAGYRQTLPTLRALELLTASGRMSEDVAAARRDPSTRLKEILRARVQTAYAALGCSDGELAFLEQAGLTARQLDERLETISCIRSLKSKPARSAAIGALRALADLVIHCGDSAWLATELETLEEKRTNRAARSGRPPFRSACLSSRPPAASCAPSAPAAPAPCGQ